MHAEIHNEVHPLVFIMLPNKTEETYFRMFSALIECIEFKGMTTNVTDASIDFELAARNAVLRAIGNISLHFCYFHFCQTTWRKLQQLGLATLYNTNDEFSLLSRKVNALAFLPVDDVTKGLEILQKSAPNQALPFMEYFKNTFVLGTFRKNGARSKPLFSPCEWNVYNQVLNGSARTTNAVEAWHRRFGVLVRSKSNICTVIDAMRKEARVVQTRILQLESGVPPQTRKG